MTRRGPLERELLRLRGAQLDTGDLEELAAWDRAATAAAEARVADATLKTGDRAPLRALASGGRPSGRMHPRVVTWYLSSHSAFCRAGLTALAGAFAGRAGDLLVLTPEPAARAAGLAAALSAPFDIRHDTGEIAAAFGVRYRPPAEFLRLLALDGPDLPLPAAFVIASDGTVHERFVHPDSRFRGEPERLARAADAAG